MPFGVRLLQGGLNSFVEVGSGHFIADTVPVTRRGAPFAQAIGRHVQRDTNGLRATAVYAQYNFLTHVFPLANKFAATHSEIQLRGVYCMAESGTAMPTKIARGFNHWGWPLPSPANLNNYSQA